MEPPTMYQREEINQKVLNNYMKPFIFHKDSRKKLIYSFVLLTFAKILGTAPGFIFRALINNTVMIESAAGSAVTTGVAWSLTKTAQAMGLFGLTRLG